MRENEKLVERLRRVAIDMSAHGFGGWAMVCADTADALESAKRDAERWREAGDSMLRYQKEGKTEAMAAIVTEMISHALKRAVLTGSGNAPEFPGGL